jgi:uncharacterized peroxidase-related enzyme
MNLSFPIHSAETAPEMSRPHLAQARKQFGMVPNLLGVMAESPATLRGYLAAATAFGGSSLSPIDQHVVLQTVNAVNACHYCQAAHSAAALKALKVTPAMDAALRTTRPLDDPRLEALRAFTRKVVGERGWVKEADVRAFLDAGFTKAQVLEVVLAVGTKTISNYINHIAATPLDAAYAAYGRLLEHGVER